MHYAELTIKSYVIWHANLHLQNRYGNIQESIRAYLEPYQTSKMELFRENSKRVLILKYFFKNNSIKAVQHHPKYAYELFVSSLVQSTKRSRIIF